MRIKILARKKLHLSPGKLAAREQHLLKVEALNAIIGHLKAKNQLTAKEISQIEAAREKESS